MIVFSRNCDKVVTMNKVYLVTGQSVHPKTQNQDDVTVLIVAKDDAEMEKLFKQRMDIEHNLDPKLNFEIREFEVITLNYPSHRLVAWY